MTAMTVTAKAMTAATAAAATMKRVQKMEPKLRPVAPRTPQCRPVAAVPVPVPVAAVAAVAAAQATHVLRTSLRRQSRRRARAVKHQHPCPEATSSLATTEVGSRQAVLLCRLVTLVSVSHSGCGSGVFPNAQGTPGTASLALSGSQSDDSAQQGTKSHASNKRRLERSKEKVITAVRAPSVGAVGTATSATKPSPAGCSPAEAGGSSNFVHPERVLLNQGPRDVHLDPFRAERREEILTGIQQFGTQYFAPRNLRYVGLSADATTEVGVHRSSTQPDWAKESQKYPSVSLDNPPQVWRRGRKGGYETEYQWCDGRLGTCLCCAQHAWSTGRPRCLVTR